MLKLVWSDLILKVHSFRLLHANGLQGCIEERIKSVRGQQLSSREDLGEPDLGWW